MKSTGTENDGIPGGDDDDDDDKDSEFVSSDTSSSSLDRDEDASMEFGQSNDNTKKSKKDKDKATVKIPKISERKKELSKTFKQINSGNVFGKMKINMSELHNKDDNPAVQISLAHHKTLTEKKLHTLTGATATFNRSFKKMQSLEETSPNFNSNFSWGLS